MVMFMRWLYMARVYQQAYLPRENRDHSGLTLHFAPAANTRLRSINVLPDFLGHNHLTISKVTVDGVDRYDAKKDGPPAPWQTARWSCSREI